MLRSLILFLTLLLSTTLGYSAEPITIPKVIITQGQNAEKKPTDWKFKVRPMWEVNTEGAYEFFWGINLFLPASDSISNIQAQNAIVGFSKEGDTRQSGKLPLFIKMTAMSDSFIVTLKDNTRIQFQIDISLDTNVIFSEGCEESFLKIEPATTPGKEALANAVSLPFFFAYKCDKTDSGMALSVTLPQEVKWTSSTIFETKGKGKRWKSFDFNPQAPGNEKNTLGTFLLDFKGKEYSLAVVLDKLVAQRDIAKFRLALGLINLDIKSVTSKDVMAKPAAHVAFEIRPWLPEIALGAEGISSLPSVSTSNYFTHTESLAYVGYTFRLHQTWSIEPRIYGYMADGISQKLQFFYTINSLSFGFEAKYRLTELSTLGMEFFMMTSPNQKVNSARLSWSQKKTTTQNNGWGLFFAYQKADINLLSKNNGHSLQYFLGPFLEF